MKRFILVVVILGLAALGSMGFIKQRTDRPVQAAAPSAPTVSVDVAALSRSTLRHTVEVFGSLSPKNTTELKSELVGRVLRVRVKEWDQVKPKDVLLEIDPTDYRLELNRNEAGLRMSKAQLLQANVEINRAKREWNRAMKLKEGGLITGQELDERKTGLESAEAQMALARAQIGQMEAQAAESRRKLEKTTIESPIEGTVSQRMVDVGDFLDVGTPVFNIVDNRMLDFKANVSAIDLTRVVEGQKLIFTVDGMSGQEFHGVVKRVNPLVSSSDRSGRIQAEVQNPEGGALRGGLYARGHILVEEHRDVLVVPKAALMDWNIEKGSAQVFVVDEGGTARLIPILTGLAGEDVIEVKSGLTGGEIIVVRGGFNVREGERIEVNKQEGTNGGKAPEGVPSSPAAPAGPGKAEVRG